MSTTNSLESLEKNHSDKLLKEVNEARFFQIYNSLTPQQKEVVNKKAIELIQQNCFVAQNLNLKEATSALEEIKKIAALKFQDKKN